MINFGYSISKDAQVDYDKLDRSMSKKIEKLEPTFSQCINCGTCAATCTAAQHTDFNFRRMSLMIRRGIQQDVEAQVSKCMLCAKCKLQCPRGVNTRNVIVSIRKVLNS